MPDRSRASRSGRSRSKISRPSVAPQGFYNQGFPGDSLIGYDLLAQFLVRIDYPRRRLWLRREPAAAASARPDPQARSVNAADATR